MISSGMPEAQDDHALKAVQVGFEMISAVSEFNQRSGKKFQIRVGINSGPVYAGFFFLKKFIFF